MAVMWTDVEVIILMWVELGISHQLCNPSLALLQSFKKIIVKQVLGG